MATRASAYSDKVAGNARRAAFSRGSSSDLDGRRESSVRSSSARSSSARKSGVSDVGFLARHKGLVALLVAVLAIAIVYPQARTYYINERNKERLAAEYAAVQERNETISAQVDALSTDEGVEDVARYEYGWVKEDENAVVVSGVDSASPLATPDAVKTSTISAPTTWYTGILDIVFFTDTSSPIEVNSYSGDRTGGAATTYSSSE